MITAPAQIDLWLGVSSENRNVEFKEAKNQYDNTKLFRYCVALANEGGGPLILGVSDRPPRRVCGTAAFRDTVDMAEKLFQKLGFRVDIEEVRHPDGRVVVFHIPSRLHGSAYHLEGAYLMRSGEELVPMSEDQLRKIFREGEPDWLEEISTRELDAVRVAELLDTQEYFRLLELPYPTEVRSVIGRLVQDRLVDQTANGTYAIRRLGAILLAKRMVDFQDLVRKSARVVIYRGKSKIETRLDRSHSKGYAVGFQELVQFVLDQFPQRELIKNALRQESRLAPEVIVRELVANALVHQDFRMAGASVMIEVYEDRVEFTNPGAPVVPTERFIDGYQSRNERLADFMRRMHICEEKSSGIDKVVTAAEEFQLPAPDFRATHGRTSAVVFGPRNFVDMDREARLRACYQHCVLRYLRNEPMTNQSLRERFRLPEKKSAIVSQIIAAGIEAGQIKADEKVGTSRKLARYLPFWA